MEWFGEWNLTPLKSQWHLFGLGGLETDLSISSLSVNSLLPFQLPTVSPGCHRNVVSLGMTLHVEAEITSKSEHPCSSGQRACMARWSEEDQLQQKKKQVPAACSVTSWGPQPLPRIQDRGLTSYILLMEPVTNEDLRSRIWSKSTFLVSFPPFEWTSNEF